jgi:hypothetical protein
MATNKYFAIQFRQRPKGPLSLLFTAPAEEISQWAGVPRKSAAFMKGFQRAIIDSHVDDIANYFSEVEENISPTAVVVAFKPGKLRITHSPQEFPGNQSEGQLVTIEVETPEFDKLSTKELASMAARTLRGHLGSNIPSIAGDQEQQSASQEEAAEEDSEEEEIPESLLNIEESHLQDFLEQLENPDWIQQATNEDEENFRSMLSDLLKPATIVDGQHRTRGAARCEQLIPFAVVALIDAPWKEEVFQFVVINQRARPIQAEFLSAIVSSSLSPEDILDLKARLEQAGVDLLSTQIIDLVHGNKESPFAGMIDFKISGGEGKLKFNGMLNLAKRFRKLRTHDPRRKFPAFFKLAFFECTPGDNLVDKRTKWQEINWFTFFSIFWGTVKEHFEAKGFINLWEPGSNLLKIVTLQELQNLFLDWLFARLEPISSDSDFKELAQKYLANLEGSFFTDVWKLTSLQSDSGRKYLRQALQNAVEQPSYKRNDALFKGLSSNQPKKR